MTFTVIICFPCQGISLLKLWKVSNSETSSTSYILLFTWVLFKFSISLIPWPSQHDKAKTGTEKEKDTRYAITDLLQGHVLQLVHFSRETWRGQERTKEIQTYRKFRFEWQAKQIYSLSSNYAPRGANPSKKSLLGRWRPQAISLGDGITSLGRKPWNAIEARRTMLGTEMTKHIHWHGPGCTSLTAAADSVCKGCHPLWLHTFLGCPCHFVQHGSPLGSQCTGEGSK